MLIVYMALALLVCAAQVWGRALPGGVLAYVSSSQACNCLNVMSLPQRTVFTLTEEVVNSGGMAWSADGRLAFLQTFDDSGQVFMWDGAALTNHSNSPANEALPLWWTPPP
jgi:hypothetical protein